MPALAGTGGPAVSAGPGPSRTLERKKPGCLSAARLQVIVSFDSPSRALPPRNRNRRSGGRTPCSTRTHCDPWPFLAAGFWRWRSSASRNSGSSCPRWGALFFLAYRAVRRSCQPGNSALSAPPFGGIFFMVLAARGVGGEALERFVCSRCKDKDKRAGGFVPDAPKSPGPVRPFLGDRGMCC